MHTFIYPIKNSYITSETGYDFKNFSLDSTLEIKSQNNFVPIYHNYVTQSVTASVISCNAHLLGYVGNFTGSLMGYASYMDAIVSGSASFYTDYFSGSYNSYTYDGYSGSLNGVLIDGKVAGIFSGYAENISGSISHFTGSALSGSSYVGLNNVYNPYISYNIVSEKSRTLMEFDLTEISKSVSSGNIKNSGSLKFYLTLKNAKANEIPLTYNIIAYPLSQSWDIGVGRYQLGGTDTGVSWQYRDYNGGMLWEVEGGTLIDTISSSQNFNHTDSDIKLDITNIANSWISGSIPNYGLVLLTSLESSSVESNNYLRFFGTETNTIYSPYLDTYWDDSVYNTGSLISVTYPYAIVLQNLKSEYKFGSIPKIVVFARPQNPLKNFTKGLQLSQYITSSYLPTSSYYSVKDNESEEIFIDFDDGTKISCDGTNNYFMLDTTGLPQERYFRILVKTINTDGEVNIFDNKNIFKITR